MPRPACLDPIGGEQQASGFDSTAGNDVYPRPDRRLPAAEVRDPDARDRSRALIGEQFDGRRMQHHRDVVGLFQGAAISFAESGRCAQLPHPVRELGRIDPERVRRQRRPFGDLVAIAPELAVLLGSPVVGQQVGLRERPPTVRHPVAPPEVDIVERCAPPTPGVRRAAKQPEAGRVQGKVPVNVRARVEVLYARIEPQAPALQDDDGSVAAHQLAGDSDAGRPGPDHADVGLEHAT